MGLVGYDERTKEELVQWVTNNNDCTSLRTITYEEADRIIKQLTGTNARVSVHPWGAFLQSNPRHRKVLSLCQTYGWTIIHPKTNKEIADINALGNWLHTDVRAPVKKPLKKMDDTELSKVIQALTLMIKKKYK